LNLRPGTNTFSTYSVDGIGNVSPVQTATVFYVTLSPLTLLANGSGAITGASTGASLVVGTNYTVAAVPNPGNYFLNWTGGVSSTNNPLTFLMESNMTLTANFFLPAAGIYNGLFSVPGGVTEETAGMLGSVALETNGAYSGRLFVAGTNYSLSGGFDNNGHALIYAGPLVVDLTLTPANQIVGTVSNTSALWSANLRADFGVASLPPAEFSILFLAIGATTNAPPGEGYGLATNTAGTVTLSGALADGTSFNQNVTVSQSGDLPIYSSLYGGTGLLLGWINLTNLGAAPPANLLTWIKKASGATALYTNGFTNLLARQGAPWTNPPANTPALLLTNGQLIISNAGASLTFNVAVANDSTLTVLSGGPTNSLSGSITPKTGLLTLTFGNGNGAATTQGVGAVLQNSNTGGGFFLTATNAGAILLRPGH
jgi:hypothetical protein